MPFGICSALEVFQKLNTKVFGDIPGVEIYFDDIVIAGTDIDDHDRIMNIMLDRAKKYNIKFNHNKIQYKVKQIIHVGMIISKNGVKADPTQIQAIVNIKPPSNLKEMQKKLGMTNYLARFIPQYSTITAPLRELLKKKIESTWGKEQEDALIT
ncbi:Reverse transcriptase (RNA-dependent DNA polymerase) [Popillia japonica]|uniref:Reverse transcriptase (RNA-dependent DNA polymerase) n=1 Tax=Popillia japonica TaxID=7064 RepID=A0AAW1KIM9_POPJA